MFVKGSGNVVQLKFASDFLIRCESPNQRRQVQRALNAYPFLQITLAACHLLCERPVNAYNLLNVTKMMPFMGVREGATHAGQTEPFDQPTLMWLLCPPTEVNWLPLPLEKGEFNMLEKLLPNLGGDRGYKYRVREGVSSLIISHSFKHSGAYYEVAFTMPSNTFPIQIDVTSYCDMDKLCNHGEECPQVEVETLQTALEARKNPLRGKSRAAVKKRLAELSDDCNCEGYVCNRARMVVSQLEWGYSKSKGRIAGWINREIFRGRNEGDQPDSHWSSANPTVYLYLTLMNPYPIIQASLGNPA